MIRLSHLLRSSILNQSWQSVRGAKKKKVEIEVKSQSTDIINIFKDRKEPVMKTIDHYPVYVQEMGLGHKPIEMLMIGAMQNNMKYTPYQPHHSNLLQGLKRKRLKVKVDWYNFHRKIDIHNEKWDEDQRSVVTDVIGSALRVLAKEHEEQQKRIQELAALQDDED